MARIQNQTNQNQATAETTVMNIVVLKKSRLTMIPLNQAMIVQ